MDHDDQVAASVRAAVRSLERQVGDVPAPPAMARRRSPSRRVIAGVGIAAGLVAGAVTVWSLGRSGDDPAPSEVEAGAPPGGSEVEPAWEQVPLEGVAPREGASLVLLGGDAVAVAGGQTPEDPGRFTVDVVDVASGQVVSLPPLAVLNPSVAGSMVHTKARATLLLESGEVVTFPANGNGAPRLVAGPEGAGAPLAPGAQAPPGGGLVDLSVPARWDGAKGAWRPLPPLPVDDPGYERRPAVTDDGRIVLAGFQAPTLVYSPDADAWRELPPPPLPAGADRIGQPVLAAFGDRIALVDELANAAVLSLADDTWAPLEVPDDPRYVEGCQLNGASSATVAVLDRCGDVLVIDDEGLVEQLDKPVTPPQHDAVSDGRQVILLTWADGELALWRRAL
ncbi:MAG TPA: hypothetical protein VK306_01500 [Acidimicrobiales bacterium]|nr:hypothetical protein [Acidimicrobiales bacterium]